MSELAERNAELVTEDYRLAAQLVAVIAERDAHFAAEMVWEKTMMETIGEDGVGSVKAAIERLQSERDALQEQVLKLAAENHDLKHPGTYLPSKRKTPATDAMIREIGAKAVDSASDELKKLAKRSDPASSEHIHAAALYLMLISKQLRAGELS